MAYLGKTPSQATRQTYYFTATGGETTLSGADDNGLTLSFTDGGYVDVYLNGLLLVKDDDYNVNTANTISGLTALTNGDVVEIVVYDTFSVFGGEVQGDVDIQNGSLTVSGTLSVTGESQYMSVANTNLLVNDRMQVANTNLLVNDRMQVANTNLLVNDRLQVANAEALYVSLSGDTMSGDLSVSGNVAIDTNTFFVDSNTNRVGVGTTTPLHKFNVRTQFVPNKHLHNYKTMLLEATETVLQMVGEGSGSHTTSLVFSAAPAAANNKHWALAHRGSDDSNRFSIGYRTTTANNFFTHQSETTEHVIVSKTGNVGVGEVDPISRIHIGGTEVLDTEITTTRKIVIDAVRQLGEINFTGYSTGTTIESGAQIEVTSSSAWSSSSTPGNITLRTTATGSTNPQPRVFVRDNGNVGFGTVTPQCKIDIFNASSGETGTFNPNSIVRLENNANNFIETRSPNSSYTGLLFTDNTVSAGGIAYAHNGTTENNVLGLGSWVGMSFRIEGVSGVFEKTERMSINASGVTIAGSLSKGSGSFKIDHPLPSIANTHYLVHSFVEGPQADLIYRGRVALVNGQANVNIDTASNMTEGTFEILCRDVQCFTSNETGWDAVRGSVSGNVLTIEAQANTCTDTISWMVVGERKDKHMYDTSWTDEDGKVIVEPEKEIILVSNTEQSNTA